MLFSTDEGEGRALVLIHGFCETHEIWNKISSEIAKQTRVLAIDLPGFGNSPLPNTPFSIDEIAEQVLSWLQKKNIQNPVLVGHSMGGYVVLAMAKQNPQYSSDLVLVHSSPFADPEEKKENRNKSITFVKKYGVGSFLESFVPTLFKDKHHPSIPEVRAITEKTLEKTLIAYTEAMRDRSSSENFLKRYAGNTFVIAGDSDTVIPMEVSKKMSKISPNIQLKPLSATGHMGMYEQSVHLIEILSRIYAVK